MANRLVLRPGLNSYVAARFARPVVADLLDRAERAAKEAAPPAKLWVTEQDERVRYSHNEVDGDQIPGNVPFLLPKADGSVGHDRAAHPKDANLPIEQRINCRCEAHWGPEVAESIRTGEVQVNGARVSGEVGTRFERAAESEFAEDGGGWMRAGLDAAEQRVRSFPQPR